MVRCGFGGRRFLEGFWFWFWEWRRGRVERFGKEVVIRFGNGGDKRLME